MVVCYLHLLRLHPGTSLSDFGTLLRQHGTSYRYRVAVFSQTRFHVAEAQHIDRDILTGQWLPLPSVGEHWDCMALLVPSSTSPSPPGGSVVPNALAHMVGRAYSLQVAVSGRQLESLEKVNVRLHAAAALEGAPFNDEHLQRLRAKVLRSSSQKLEASPELLDRARALLLSHGARPVTMLNLLKFNPEEPGLQSYKEYGARFRSVGGARGGNAKIVGKVLQPAWIDSRPTAGTRAERWDEVAIVHYPNIVAFCDMAAGEDYQDINHKYRLPALQDTLLLCTREIPLAAEPGSALAITDGELSSKL